MSFSLALTKYSSKEGYCDTSEKGRGKRPSMGENLQNARFKNGHTRVEMRVLKTLACRKNVGGFFKRIRDLSLLGS